MLVMTCGRERTQEVQKLIEEVVCSKPPSHHFALTESLQKFENSTDLRRKNVLWALIEQELSPEKRGLMRLSSVARLDNLFARVPLPRGEGRAKRRVRVQDSTLDPHPALRATFSPREKDLLVTFRLFGTALVYDRPSCATQPSSSFITTGCDILSEILRRRL
jgi:hypothetical protein